MKCPLEYDRNDIKTKVLHGIYGADKRRVKTTTEKLNIIEALI